jgi:hypothetical protein
MATDINPLTLTTPPDIASYKEIPYKKIAGSYRFNNKNDAWRLSHIKQAYEMREAVYNAIIATQGERLDLRNAQDIPNPKYNAPAYQNLQLNVNNNIKLNYSNFEALVADNNAFVETLKYVTTQVNELLQNTFILTSKGQYYRKVFPSSFTLRTSHEKCYNAWMSLERDQIYEFLTHVLNEKRKLQKKQNISEDTDQTVKKLSGKELNLAKIKNDGIPDSCSDYKKMLSERDGFWDKLIQKLDDIDRLKTADTPESSTNAKSQQVKTVAEITARLKTMNADSPAFQPPAIGNAAAGGVEPPNSEESKAATTVVAAEAPKSEESNKAAVGVGAKVAITGAAASKSEDSNAATTGGSRVDGAESATEESNAVAVGVGAEPAITGAAASKSKDSNAAAAGGSRVDGAESVTEDSHEAAVDVGAEPVITGAAASKSEDSNATVVGGSRVDGAESVTEDSNAAAVDGGVVSMTADPSTSTEMMVRNPSSSLSYDTALSSDRLMKKSSNFEIARYFLTRLTLVSFDEIDENYMLLIRP